MCRSSGTAAAQATFFVILAAGCGVFFVFSFAANSCRTLLAIASASTSYAVAASLRTEVGLPREDASRRLASTISRESVPSSARRRKALSVFPMSPSSRFCRMPCCRANVSTRFSSMTLINFSRMKSRSRFKRRTGTAAPTAARTRRPAVLAMACSLRCLSCSAFHFSSLRLAGCFE
jgi:hypothetical protein